MPSFAVNRRLTALLLFPLMGSAAAHGQEAAASPPDFATIQPMLEKYCYQCHDGDVQKGDLRLDEFESTKAVLRERKTWLHVLEQLETGEMPTKEPLPSEAEYEEMILWVDRAVNQLDWEKIKNPGHVTIPRLTKSEYNRTIRDLFGLDSAPGDVFSEDGEGRSGFNNDRDGLFITASQMEKYFEAAEKSVDAVMALNLQPLSKKFEAEEMFMTEARSAKSKVDDDEAIGYVLNRGQMTLYDSIDVPADGFYKFSIRARSTTNGPTSGVLRLNDVTKGVANIAGREPQVAEIDVFLAKGSHQMAWNINLEGLPKPAKQAPEKKHTVVPKNAGEIINRESKTQSPVFPVKGNEPEELLKKIQRWDANQSNVQRPYEWLRLHGENGDPAELRRFNSYIIDRSRVPNELRTEISKELGITEAEFDKRVRATNPEKVADRKKLFKMSQVEVVKDRTKPGDFAVDWIQVDGPIAVGDVERAKAVAGLFTSDKDAMDEATELIRRAFRRPVSKSELARFRAVYEASRNVGLNHAESMKQMLVAVLVSPNFLYRVEIGEGDEFELDEWQLASRLSYFLWQTMPDDALFAEAKNDTLLKNLEAQVVRMLADKKADVFYETFGGQWLGYSGLGETLNPDSKAFKEFSPALAKAMKAESNWLFESIFRENRPMTDLITARETVMNGPLARHYGIDGISGDALQRVALKTDQRGGILGMGSILTATSTPVRTSPVLRGVFIMERLLGDEPGEPPADAGELPGNAGPNRGKTLREELEIHRDREDCASCHDKIDPLGFGLENFDAIGRYRTKEGKKAIDTTGTLPDGTTFKGVNDLRNYLLNNRRDDFLRNVTERLMKFALGRELQTPDEAAIREILKRGEETGFRGADLVKSIVGSYPFQNQAAEVVTD